MNTYFSLFESTDTRFLGSRHSALSLRDKLSNLLIDDHKISVDFKNISVTQSFIDEFIGVLILKTGPNLLSRISFKSCSPDVKEILKLVIDRRIIDYSKSHQH